MSFHYHPAIGNFHLNEAAPRRNVPGPERHRWDSKMVRGHFSQCEKCGCLRMYNRDYSLYYKADAASPLQPERPPCTGPTEAEAPPAPPVAAASAATASPDAARAPAGPPMLPGLTASHDEPAPPPYPTLHPEPPTTDDQQAPYHRD